MQFHLHGSDEWTTVRVACLHFDHISRVRPYQHQTCYSDVQAHQMFLLAGGIRSHPCPEASYRVPTGMDGDVKPAGLCTSSALPGMRATPTATSAPKAKLLENPTMFSGKDAHTLGQALRKAQCGHEGWMKRYPQNARPKAPP